MAVPKGLGTMLVRRSFSSGMSTVKIPGGLLMAYDVPLWNRRESSGAPAFGIECHVRNPEPDVNGSKARMGSSYVSGPAIVLGAIHAPTPTAFGARSV